MQNKSRTISNMQQDIYIIDPAPDIHNRSEGASQQFKSTQLPTHKLKSNIVKLHNHHAKEQILFQTITIKRQFSQRQRTTNLSTAFARFNPFS